MDRHIGTLRRSDELVAVVSRRNEGSTDPTVHYSVEYIPFAEAPLVLLPDRDMLIMAWDRLGSVRTIGAAVTVDTVRMLACSIGVTSEQLSTPGPIESKALVPPRATARHARAFRGTTVKPPSSAAKVLNLRHYLCSASGTSEVLAAMTSSWTDGLELLRRNGVEIGLLSGHSMPGSAWGVYLAVNHSLVDGRISGLPEWFANQFLWSLRGADWPQVQIIIELLRAIDAPNNPIVSAVAARLVSLASAEVAAGWLSHATRLPAADHEKFLATVIVDEEQIPDSELLSVDLVDSMHDVLRSADFAEIFGWVLRCSSQGVSPGYLRAGLAFADVSVANGNPRSDARFDEEVAEPLINHLATVYVDRSSEYLRKQLWAHCGELPILMDVIASESWTDLPPQDAEALLWLYLRLPWSYGDQQALELAATDAVRRLDQIVTTTAMVDPGYKRKWFSAVEDIYCDWKSPYLRATAMPELLACMERLARPPFATHSNAVAAVIALLEHASLEYRSALVMAPDRIFTLFEKACRRRNDADLIARGMSSLAESHADLAIFWLLNDTNRFLKAVLLLGTLRIEVRSRVVADVRGPNTAESEGPLDAELAELETAATVALSNGMPVSDVLHPSIRHALQIRGNLSANRTAFRKFLRAHLRGDSGYIQRHPLNRQWIQNHPTIDESMWQQGVTHRVTLPGIGDVTLDIERDPLEMLRLGTYVGSCLGIGGAFVDSAVAVALDINKAVVYARNKRGSVIARQQVAISEQDTLVVFAVYPGNTGAAMKRTFAEFDRLLSNALGLPIEKGSEYEIANPVSHDWYDDSRWQFSDSRRRSGANLAKRGKVTV